MKVKEKIRLNIGDSLYNYQSFKGVFTYKVIGVRDYSDVVLFEIECQECSDHAKCKLLVSQIDNIKRFTYVSMIDEDEDNEQYYWHNHTEFFLTKNDCKKIAYVKVKEQKEKRIEELKEKLKQEQQSLAEIKSLIEGII